MCSSMTTTSASPLPRLLMVAVNGLNSQKPTATRRDRVVTPCNRSSASICLRRVYDVKGTAVMSRDPVSRDMHDLV